jgi:hypothetical protein
MNSWLAPVYGLLFLALWRMVYEAANAGTPALSPSESLQLQTYQPEAQTPLQKEWADKAVKRYTEAQEKKWQRWNEAMFERSS